MEEAIQNLIKLKTHFSKTPGRIYSQAKIKEKENSLENLRKIFNEEAQKDKNNVKILEYIEKAKKLTQEINNFIENQKIVITRTMNKIEFF